MSSCNNFWSALFSRREEVAVSRVRITWKFPYIT